jgi:tetratricopeptide (TPR) repeat protein
VPSNRFLQRGLGGRPAASCRRTIDGGGGHLGNLGSAYAALGQVERAIETYEQALAIHREICGASTERSAEWTEARRGERNHLGGLGSAYAALGQAGRAIEYHEQALAISRGIGDRRGGGIWAIWGWRMRTWGRWRTIGISSGADDHQIGTATARNASGQSGGAYADLGQTERSSISSRRWRSAGNRGPRAGSGLNNLGMNI